MGRQADIHQYPGMNCESACTPSVWKRSYGLSKDKHASLNKAQLMFPTAELHLAKNDGRAEALLIAEYCRWFFTKLEAV